ncbi:MAG: alpha/beta hydrolase fold domain-containing protein [Urechidicola sp.]|nr:alpha/beta hydrolase fold domain-containing protein [Urechidicola sp.]
MNEIRNFPIKSSSHSKPIVTDILFRKNDIKKPIVIFCHGYKGYKDWGAWNLMAKSFADANLFFVKFNFSHNGGTLENPIDFPDLNAFGENNFIKELNDLEDVINWVLNNDELKEEINTQNISLIGHSRGGGIVTIKGSENNHIAKVITLNGVSDYASRFLKGEDLMTWKKNNVMYVTNGRTKQEMPHFYQFYQNFQENEKRLTISKAVESLKKPLLIINGTEDVVVTPMEGENMHTWNNQSKFLLIEGMNHTLGSKHPWLEKNLPLHMSDVVNKCIAFIKKTLE